MSIFDEKKYNYNPWLDAFECANLFDLQIWQKLREIYPKFSILKYFILDWIHQTSKQAYDHRDEFQKWIGLPYIPSFGVVDIEFIASYYNVNYTTISRHLAYLIKNGFVLKDTFGKCLADDIEEIFLDSTKNVDDENILLFDNVFFHICKSTEEALVFSYVSKRLIDTDIKRVSISEIKKALLLDPKTVNRALINLEKNSYVKVDKKNVCSTNFPVWRYRKTRDKLRKNGNAQL